MTEENVGKVCEMSNSHAHSDTELEVGLPLQASVTELSDDVITINVDQPHPPANDEEYTKSQPCDEPHPLPSPCSEAQLSQASHDPSKPRLSTCSNHNSLHIEEAIDIQQPLPLHEPNSKSHFQISSNPEPHPLAETSNPNKESTMVTKDQLRLVLSNHLLFELD